MTSSRSRRAASGGRRRRRGQRHSLRWLTGDGLLVVPFLISGVTHLVKPEVFMPIVPDALPGHRRIIIVSGLAELLCAAGLLTPGTRRAAGWASFALLLAVFPANLKMAADAQHSPSAAMRCGTVARLPLQIPLLRRAARAGRGLRSRR